MNALEDANMVVDIARNCIAVRLRAINRAISALYDEALRPVGIRVSQLNILVAASLLGPISPARLCHVLILDPSTLSRNVERMKRHNWLRLIPGPDERSHLIEVLPDGLEKIRAGFSSWREAQTEAASVLGTSGVAEVMKIGGNLMAGDSSQNSR